MPEVQPWPFGLGDIKSKIHLGIFNQVQLLSYILFFIHILRC